MKLCRFLGHVKSGVITGFRRGDSTIITYCKRCGVPMVDESYRACRHIADTVIEDQNNRLGINTDNK